MYIPVAITAYINMYVPVTTCIIVLYYTRTLLPNCSTTCTKLVSTVLIPVLNSFLVPVPLYCIMYYTCSSAKVRVHTSSRTALI